MIIAGIDPGTATTGYAVIETNGTRIRLVDFGCIRTSSSLPGHQRINQIYDEMCELLDTYKPSVLAIERLFFNRNVTNAINVGQASGVVILAAAQRNIEVFSYTPLQVKMALTGYGRADKKQMQAMVKRLLGLDEVPKPDDAADAIAVAICHANSTGLEEQLKRID